MSSQQSTIEYRVEFTRQGPGGVKSLRLANDAAAPPSPGRIPRLARYMALAIRFGNLIAERQVANQAQLAQLGHVSRTRITQIMKLTLLAPDIQEDILFLPCTHQGRDPIRLAELQPIAAASDWRKQRILWRKLRLAKCAP